MSKFSDIFIGNTINTITEQKIIKILLQNKILTTLDFLREDLEKIATITKISVPDIIALRSEIFKKCSANLVNAAEIHQQYFDTGIKSLNEITGMGFPIRYITEICGLAGSGKSQLSIQLSINCAKFGKCLLYIDTKGDFSSVNIKNNLDTCGYGHKNMAEIMNRIKVIRIWNMEELIELFDRLKDGLIVIDNLHGIIIDSLPCLMFQHLGDNNKIGLSFLNKFVNTARYLCNEFSLSIICVNILTRWMEQEVSEIEDMNTFPAETTSELCWKETRIRCLGRYWQHIPALVLTLEKLQEITSDDSKMKIKVTVTKSIETECNKSCELEINSYGVT